MIQNPREKVMSAVRLMLVVTCPHCGALRLSNSARKKRAAGLLKSDFVSPPVRQSLARRVLDRKDCTFPIVVAELDAMVVPGINSARLLLFAVLIIATHGFAMSANVPSSRMDS